MFLPDFKDDLRLENQSYFELVKKYWEFVLESDEVLFDVSAELTLSKQVYLDFVARESCYVAGLEELKVLFAMFPEIEFEFLKVDGDFVLENEVFLTLKADSRLLLSLERMILNFVARMSSICSQSKIYADFVAKFNNPVKVMSTRKGLLGPIDKKAVSLAGVLTHRLNLGSAVMVKDNHWDNLDLDRLKADILPAVEFIEFEFDSLDQFKKVADKVVPILTKFKAGILLDNFSLPDLKLALDFFETEFKNRSFFIEASGGVSLESLGEYDLKGLDAVSTSQVFAYARVVDLSAVLR